MKREYENVINHLKAHLKYSKAFEMKEEFSRAITALSQQPLSGEEVMSMCNRLADYHKEIEETEGLADKGKVQVKHAKIILASLTPNKGLTAEEVIKLARELDWNKSEKVPFKYTVQQVLELSAPKEQKGGQG